MTRRKRLLFGGLLFLVGYACGGSGASPVAAAMQLLELGGASLARQLAQAGSPPITPASASPSWSPTTARGTSRSPSRARTGTRPRTAPRSTR